MTDSSPIHFGSFRGSSHDSPTPTISPIASKREPSTYPEYEFLGTERYFPRMQMFAGGSNKFSSGSHLKKIFAAMINESGDIDVNKNPSLDDPNKSTLMHKQLIAYNVPVTNNEEDIPPFFPTNIWSSNFQSQRSVSLFPEWESKLHIVEPHSPVCDVEVDSNYVLHNPQPTLPIKFQFFDPLLFDDEKLEFAKYMGPELSKSNVLTFRDQNGQHFSVPPESRFFVIKSNNFLDIFASFRNKVWSSTELGNKRLNNVFNSLTENGKVFLFYLVNGSGQFCGIAEMRDSVDYSQSCNIWVEQTRYKGIFPVEWLMVKNVPNKYFNHLKIPDNDNKPVTCSRDTQEMPYSVGLSMLKIFSSFRVN